MKEEPISSIDRDSYEPAYSQLVNILRSQIASGKFRPGDRLPSEAQLRERYGVSPMTVRRAINRLVDQGIVIAEQGRGTFVKPVELTQAAFDFNELKNLFSNKETIVKILKAKIISADEIISRKLAIDPGTRIIYLCRQLSLEQEPILYHRAYLIYDSSRPLVEDDMGVTSLKGLFDGSGANGIKKGELTIKATILNKEEADVLNSSPGTSAFHIEHIFYDFKNKPISWGWFIFPGDRLSFTATVGIQ